MNNRRLLLFCGILLLFSIIIHFYSGNSTRVEMKYSTGIYPSMSAFLRYILGWLPFSFGDILYGFCVIWLIWKLVKMIKAIFTKQVTVQNFIVASLKTLTGVLLIYIYFNIFWGINYNRKGIAEQLQLNMEKYNKDDLKNINALLVEKVNITKQALIDSQTSYPNSKQLFIKVKQAYNNLESTYSFLQYRPISLKSSLWGWLGNYTSFTGYYNPFTGEAQVNTTVPKFLQPFIACHEVAHQLGYAKEMEANFVGYLAASSSPDPLLQYSVYLDLFLYSNRNLYNDDTASANLFARQLLPAIKTDLKEWKDFNKKHKSPIEPIVRWIYGKYLENNEQPQGVLSYDEVTGFLIAYYKKFGKI